MVNEIPMTIDLESTTSELKFDTLVERIGDDLSAIIFSNDPIRKMRDSLPMALFRFEVLEKLSEARELGWFAYFLPWVLLNGGMSDQNVDSSDRMEWFLIAYCSLPTCMNIYQEQQLEPGMSTFRTKKDARTVRRMLFDRKLLTWIAPNLIRRGGDLVDGLSGRHDLYS
jgi:hypothetical protein